MGCPRLMFVLVLAALVAASPAIASETPHEVLARIQSHVAAGWAVTGGPEAATRIGFSGTFWPRAKVDLRAKCDGGPVGVVTYTTSEEGVVCAAYPHRGEEGELQVKVALAAPDAPVQEFEFPPEGGGLSKKSGEGVLLSGNPDNETPELKAAAEKSMAMAACQPRDIQQAMACLDAHWPETTKRQFAALAPSEVIRAHFGVGMWIRNNWGLWQGGPLRDFFAQQSVRHPDEMSSVLLHAYWLRSNGCKENWNNVVAVSAAFARALRGQVCAAS